MRPGAGRPRGARNKVTQELKEMLGPLDEMAIKRLKSIVMQGSDKQALEGIRLAWEYRHGRPKGQGEYAERQDILADHGAVLVIGGDEHEYIAAWRKAIGE